MSDETLYFDGKGDSLAGFPAVNVEFEVTVEHTSDGAGEFIRNLVEHEIKITEITYHHDGEDCMDKLKTWYIKTDATDSLPSFKSFYVEIQDRIDSIVSNNLEGYMYD